VYWYKVNDLTAQVFEPLNAVSAAWHLLELTVGVLETGPVSLDVLFVCTFVNASATRQHVLRTKKRMGLTGRLELIDLGFGEALVERGCCLDL